MGELRADGSGRWADRRARATGSPPASETLVRYARAGCALRGRESHRLRRLRSTLNSRINSPDGPILPVHGRVVESRHRWVSTCVVALLGARCAFLDGLRSFVMVVWGCECSQRNCYNEGLGVAELQALQGPDGNSRLCQVWIDGNVLDDGRNHLHLIARATGLKY